VESQPKPEERQQTTSGRAKTHPGQSPAHPAAHLRLLGHRRL